MRWVVASLRSICASGPRAKLTFWLLPVALLLLLWTLPPWAPLLVLRWRRCSGSTAPAPFRPVRAGPYVLGVVCVVFWVFFSLAVGRLLDRLLA